MYQSIVPYQFTGKLNRGISVVDTVRILKGESVTEDDIFKATVLGWLVEFVSSIKKKEEKRIYILSVASSFLLGF